MLNAQEMSTNAPAASQDSPLTPRPENVSLRLNAPTVKNSSKEHALPSVTLATTSMRASASMEVASTGTLPTTSEVVSDQPQLAHLQDPPATPTSMFKTDSVLAHVWAAPTPTQPPESVWPAQPTV